MHITTRTLVAILSVLVLVVLLGSAVGGGMMGAGMMRDYGGPNLSFHGNGAGWGLGMALGWLAVLGVLVVGSLLVVRGVSAQPRGTEGAGSVGAMTTLRQRYAAGEIDQATYERMAGEITA